MAVIRSFGLHWRLDLVELDDFWIYGWEPKSQNWTSEPDEAGICINQQSGVYLLQGRDREVLYVGRTKNFGNRLWSHTRNDNRGRWSHFSWFSIDDPLPLLEHNSKKSSAVTSLGAKNIDDNMSETLTINEIEALLITSIEPKLNKRSGDWKGARKYLQFSYREPISNSDLWHKLKKKRLKKLLGKTK